MKKLFFVLVLMGVGPLALMAQDDDLYFVPKKDAGVKAPAQSPSTREQPVYYVGSDRDVDEYNRRGQFYSTYQELGDSIASDIIDFSAGNGLYPDSIYADSLFTMGSDADDFTYTRRMSRYDDFYGWYDPWYAAHWGYGAYWPYWRSYYSWYDPWYDPWYYGYAGWGWAGYYGYYGRYGYYHPWYAGWGYGWHGPSYVAYRRPTGTRNHGTGRYRSTSTYPHGSNTTTSTGAFGRTRTNTTSPTTTRTTTPSTNRGVTTNSNGNFGGNYSNTRTTSPASTRSYTPSTTRSSGSGNFGGNHTVGGGSRSGGSFGGGGSRGGGFGTRR